MTMKTLARFLTTRTPLDGMASILTTAITLAMLILPVCRVLRAQTSTAAVTGHVVDQTNGAVPDAMVRLVEQSTNVSLTTRSNHNGDFSFTNVQPGTYAVIVTASHYKELRKVDLVLSASVNLDAGIFSLQVGTVSQSVTIQADITPLQTTSSERSAVLDTQQIDNLLAIGRDVMSMTKVMPGVVEPGDGASSLGTTGAPVVNGVNNEYSMSTLDGVIGNTRGLNTLDTPLNLDAVKEVTVNQSNYQAQYGGEAGGQFSFITKNGTNRFHGGLYEYFRNEALNANTFFDKYGRTPDNYLARPRYRYNVAGGTIGGPIFWPGRFNSHRDKLFFFASSEDSPIKSPDGLKFYTVPTQLQAQGDFSQTYNQGTATQDPSTLIHIAMPGQKGSCPINSVTPGPGCVPDNVVPAGLINSQTQALLTIMYNNTLAKNPSFAFNNLAVSNNNYNYVTNYSADKPVNQEIFRIDYAPTESLHMFFRGDLTAVNDNDYNSPANNLPWLMRVNYRNTEPNFVYNLIGMFSPTLINEFNVGTAGWSEHQLYAASDLAEVTIGAGNFDLPSLYPGVNPLNLFPATTFGTSLRNAANYGWDSRFPMADQVRSYNATDKVTKVIGTHTLVLGIDAGTDWYLQPNRNRVGNLNFQQDSSNANDTNFAYGNAVFGILDQYSQNTQLLNYGPRTNRLEWYYQDTWKATPTLTIDFGLRNSWAMAQRLHAGNNFVPTLFRPTDAPTLYQYSADGKSAIDPTTGTSYPKAYAGLMVPSTGNLNNGLLYVNTAGYPQGTTYGNGVLWAPRIGFSWSVMSSTVVRANFGMFYNVRARSGQEGDLTNNAPTTNGTTQYYSNADPNSPNFYAAPGVGNLNGPFTIGHALPLHGSVPYAEETSLGVQQALPWGVVLDVAYVGTFTKHATDYLPINEVPYGAEFEHPYCAGSNTYGCSSSGVLPDNFFRPYPGFGSINEQGYNLTANYNALQVKFTRRFRNGIEFGGAYTYSRAMDYGGCTSTSCSAPDGYNFTAAVYQNPRAWNYGPASWDLKHMLVTNYVYNLPRASSAFGDQSRWNNVVTRQLFDNWQLSGFITYYSGSPGMLNLSVNSGQNIAGGGDGARVVLTCDPWRRAHGTRSFSQWFDTGCVEPPIAGSSAAVGTYSKTGSYTPPSAATPYSLGNGVFAQKVSFFLPGYTNFETALIKRIPIQDKVTLQLRVETYNTFNHTEFNAINNVGTTASIATATFANANSQGPGNPQTSSTFGQLAGTANPRYMQLALRLDF